jgi:hypothetical protein
LALISKMFLSETACVRECSSIGMFLDRNVPYIHGAIKSLFF